MLKKTIKFQDLDGNEITEDFYFNLSKAEIAEMEISHEGGFGAYLQEISEEGDGGTIMRVFKEILSQSVGRRSEDGRRFIKTEEIKQDFMQSDAYTQLFMELVTDADNAVQFIQAILPADLAEEAAKAGREVENVELPETTSQPKDDRPAWIRENREPTREEMSKMSKDELLEAFQRKNMNRE